jgi:hypothetical protein
LRNNVGVFGIASTSSLIFVFRFLSAHAKKAHASRSKLRLSSQLNSPRGLEDHPTVAQLKRY